MKKRHHFGGKTDLPEKKVYIYIHTYAYMFVFTRIIFCCSTGNFTYKLFGNSSESDLVEFLVLIRIMNFILLNP